MTFSESYALWRDHLGGALDERYFSISWLDYVVHEGRAVLLATDKSAAVVEVRYFPTGAKDLRVICGAGDLEDMRGPLLDIMIKMAYENGCISVAVESRDGWVRALRDKGFSPYKSLLRLEL